MVDSLNALAQTCENRPGVRRALLFDDSDIAIPYLRTSPVGDPHTCPIRRETAITPFARQDWSTCGLTFIHEITPGRPDYHIYPDTTQWLSSDRRFGYRLYSPHCVK